MVGAKMQMSSRYSNKVTNCWCPKHCSIKQQKLEPAFESLNGIWVNSYRPVELALNAVFFMLLSSIASWRYPWARSKDKNQLLLWTACRALTILCNGNASLTVMEFNFWWSTHRWISPVFFCTMTTWEAYGLCKGLMIPCHSQVSKHLCTSPCSCGGMVQVC